METKYNPDAVPPPYQAGGPYQPGPSYPQGPPQPYPQKIETGPPQQYPVHTGQPQVYHQGPPQTGQPQIVQPQVIYQTVVANQTYGFVPVNTVCPYCHAQIVTGIRYDPGALTWLMCGGLFIFGCAFGCCLIPFCIDGCKDATHFCPNCSKTLAERRRM